MSSHLPFRTPSQIPGGILNARVIDSHTHTPAFISDMQIIRAARDLPADTELTFSYVTLADPPKMNETLLKSWSFQCGCTLCIDNRETSVAVKKQRGQRMQSFSVPSSNTKGKEGIVK
ncbi:hypothetical protein BDZ45DRAFT_749713 [Acephala macrosclerotiorum]|nr:hypothetical protein BDZ45DRAFT_749713 [Acephala macrosclerotiorum]